MPQESLIDFFTYYKGQPHQKEAIQLLQQSMPDSLLQPTAAWIEAWRTAPPPPPAPEWPVTKEQMGYIMGCSPAACLIH